MKISEAEMTRRLLMANAQMEISNAMRCHELTAMEWVSVLTEVMRRMIGYGLKEEWDDLDTPE